VIRSVHPVALFLSLMVVLTALTQGTGEGLVRESSYALQAGPVFLTAPSYPTHNYAPAVASGDFNGDGRPDLVVANGCPPISIPPDQCATTSGGVSVFLTNTDGTLGAPQSYLSGGEGSQSVVVGDFNGDGKLDLAIANTCFSAIDCSTGGVSILLGNGDGSFSKAHNYPSGGYLGTAVAIGDFNRDGILDLAVSNYCTSGVGTNCANGEVSVFLGRGDGSFKSPVSYSPRGCGAVVAVAVADLNGDGNPDLALADNCTSGEVIILLGNGDGTFQAPQSYASGAFIATSVAVGDFNGDGKIDLAVGHVTANGTVSTGVVSVLIGNGDGTLQTARIYATGIGSAASVTVADVNQDGKLDLVVAVAGSGLGRSSGQVSALLGRGNGTFQTAQSYASGGIDATSLVVGDFNGDGKPDVAVANRCIAGPDCFNTANNGGLSMLLQRGGRFLAPREYTFPDCSAEATAVGDFNGDGNPDLAVVDRCGGAGGTLSVLIGKPNGTFQTGPSFSLGGFYGFSVAVADFNGDGKLDVAVTNSCTGIDQCSDGTAGLSILLGNRDGTFQAAKRYNFFGAIAYSLAVADFNGDGVPDLAVTVQNNCRGVTNCHQSVVNTLFGNGDGTFRAGQTFVSGGYFPIAVATGDFNADGKPDLAVGSRCVTKLDCSHGIIRILLNNGDGSFRVKWPSAQMPAGYLVNTIAVGDFNRDGKADLAVTNTCFSAIDCSTGGVSTLLGHGDGTFEAVQSHASGGVLANSLAVADFNGDGKTDLLVANDSNSGLLLGDGTGSFQTAQTYNEGGPSVVVADFNHDGRPDAALAGTILLLNTAHFP
jgi:FG-GAP-like repeat/FG-GAP repeat